MNSDVEGLYTTAMKQAIEASRATGTIFGAALVDEEASTVPYCLAPQGRARTPGDHSHMAVIRAAIDDDADLTRLTLVSTVEPCPACTFAAVLSDMKAIVFGTSIETLVSLGWRQIQIGAAAVSDAYTGKPVPVQGGFLETETDELCRSVPPPVRR